MKKSTLLSLCVLPLLAAGLSSCLDSPQTEAASALEDRGFKQNQYQQALYQAIETNDAELLRLLIEVRVDLNAEDAEGRTPLMYAISSGHNGLLQQLMDHGAQLPQQEKLGATALHIAAAAGNTEALRILLNISDEDVNKCDAQGKTPLYIAAKKAHTECIDILLSAGADTKLLAKAKDTSKTDMHHLIAERGIHASKQQKAAENNDKDVRDNPTADTKSLNDILSQGHLSSQSGVARLYADELFEFNSVTLRQSALADMQHLAVLIQVNPNTYFIIEGHSDNIGNKAKNAFISAQQAIAVRTWLEEMGVSSNNVYIRVCACNSPLVDIKGTVAEQKMNRRIEIHMRSQEEGVPEGCEDATYTIPLNKNVVQLLNSGFTVPKTHKTLSERDEQQ